VVTKIATKWIMKKSTMKAGFQNLINDGSIADAKNIGPNAGY